MLDRLQDVNKLLKRISSLDLLLKFANNAQYVSIYAGLISIIFCCYMMMSKSRETTSLPAKLRIGECMDGVTRPNTLTCGNMPIGCYENAYNSLEL